MLRSRAVYQLLGRKLEGPLGHLKSNKINAELTKSDKL